MAIAKTLGVHEIFICNTSNIDSMRHGRPQTVMIEKDQNLQNGAIVTLLGTQEVKSPELDHVHGIEVESQAAVIGKFIIIDPEINVEQSRRIQNSLAVFGEKPLEQEATHTAYELAKYDRIEYSVAYFKKLQDDVAAAGLGLTDEAAIAAARQAAIKAFVATLIPTAKFEIVEDAATGKLQLVANADGCLRVISVREQRIPLMFNEKHELMPESYFMVKLEVVK